MDDTTFDKALITAAFAQIGARGWHRLDLVAASREAGLDVARTRARFPGRCALLMRFGSLADQAALTGALADGPVRDRLFDMLMRRIDALQTHRAGVITLLRALPTDPAAAMLLASASLRSMVWMLKGAGIESGPLLGLARAKALLAVWLWTMRAWQRDESEDLSATMAALDQALSRAEQAESWLHRRGAEPVEAAPPEAATDDVAFDEMDPSKAVGATEIETAARVAPDTGPQADPDPPG
jgi:ubiquinone biosynthesis protein COQ9